MQNQAEWRVLSLRVDLEFTTETDILHNIVKVAVERVKAFNWGGERLAIKCKDRTVVFGHWKPNISPQEYFRIAVTGGPELFPEHEEELYVLLSDAGVIVTHARIQ